MVFFLFDANGSASAYTGEITALSKTIFLLYDSKGRFIRGCCWALSAWMIHCIHLSPRKWQSMIVLNPSWRLPGCKQSVVPLLKQMGYSEGLPDRHSPRTRELCTYSCSCGLADERKRRGGVGCANLLAFLEISGCRKAHRKELLLLQRLLQIRSTAFRKGSLTLQSEILFHISYLGLAAETAFIPLYSLSFS